MALGIFDSGVGGLTVWRALRPIMTEHTIYFGDTVHIPYGEKTQEQLVGYFQRALAFLCSARRAVVVACNTVSAVALPRVKEPPVPLFSMIDAAVRQALPVTKAGRSLGHQSHDGKRSVSKGLSGCRSRRGGGEPSMSQARPLD